LKQFLNLFLGKNIWDRANLILMTKVIISCTDYRLTEEIQKETDQDTLIFKMLEQMQKSLLKG